MSRIRTWHFASLATKPKSRISLTGLPTPTKLSLVRDFQLKDASESVKFANHESSNYNKKAVLKVVTLPAVTRDVAESLSEQYRQDKLERRK
jgi:hypothetical protein